MQNKLLIKGIIFLLLNTALFTTVSPATAQESPQDSIRKTLPTLTGQARLQALTDLHSLAAAGDDANVELAALYSLIAEANKQGNADFEGHARLKLIFCYYNYNMLDSLELKLPEQLKFMAKHEQWDYYYNAWEAKVEKLLYADKNQTALREAQLMYNDAKTRNSNYGLGVSTHTLGIIYQTLQRYDLAEKSFYEAIERLKKEEDISLRLNTYNTLCETLDADQKYTQMLPVAKEWEVTIDDYKRRAEAKGITPMLNGRYLYCYLAQTVAHFTTGQNDKAEYYLKKAEECAKGRKAISQLKLLHVKTRHLEYLQQYDKAIACADTNYRMVIDFNDSISALTVLENKARILLKAGKGMDAATTYAHVMATKDSLRNLDMAAQLDELRTIYEVDKLTLKNQITTNRLHFALIFGALLLVAVILYIIYTRRLRQKNRVLYDTIIQSQKAQEQLYETHTQAADESLAEHETLFRKLCQLMNDEKPFTDPQIKRDDLAAKLGTNRTYLSDSIKQCANGETFSEYLNRYRLRHAAIVLGNNPDMPVNEVSDISGFNSRSTFNRLFLDHYGMSPSEYRAISKEKIIR